MGYIFEALSLLVVASAALFEYSENNSIVIVVALIMSLLFHGFGSGPVTWIYFADFLPDIGVSIC